MDIAKLRLPFFAVSLCACALLASCSSSKKGDKIPRTTFITHYDNKDHPEKPFTYYWVNDQLKDTANVADEKKGKKLRLYIKPVTLAYLQQNKLTEKYGKDIEKLRDYADNVLLGAFQRLQKTVDFDIVTKPSKGAYTMEMAILSVYPTPISTNVLNNIADVVLPVPASLMAKPMETKGSIAMAVKFTDPRGRILGELADYQTDMHSLIGDVKDMQLFGHHKQQLVYWAKQLAKTFTSPRNTKVKGGPLITISPF